VSRIVLAISLRRAPYGPLLFDLRASRFFGVQVADHYWAILHLSAGSHTNGGVLKSLDQRFFKTLESSDWQTASVQPLSASTFLS